MISAPIWQLSHRDRLNVLFVALFGFFLYFMTDLVFALGLSGRIPEVFAAWTPVMVTTLIGITSLLYL